MRRIFQVGGVEAECWLIHDGSRFILNTPDGEVPCQLDATGEPGGHVLRRRQQQLLQPRARLHHADDVVHVDLREVLRQRHERDSGDLTRPEPRHVHRLRRRNDARAGHQRLCRADTADEHEERRLQARVVRCQVRQIQHLLNVGVVAELTERLVIYHPRSRALAWRHLRADFEVVLDDALNVDDLFSPRRCFGRCQEVSYIRH